MAVDKYPADRIAVARAYYEGTPGMTFAMLSTQTKISSDALSRFAKQQGWKKNYKFEEMTPLAQEAADKYNRSLAELGPEITTADEIKAADDLVTEVAVNARAAVLDRHRKEWAVPRTLSAEALKKRVSDPIAAFNAAKLAKITSETIMIVQNGERKAWGLDVGELPPNSVVVIERTK